MKGKSIITLLVLLCSTLPSRADKPPASAARARRVLSLADLIDQTAAVVEGTVTGMGYVYDPKEGPETVIKFTAEQVHAGSVPSVVIIRQKGGPMPDGTIMEWAHVPSFEQGKRYLVFLRNTEWHLSPVVDGHVFRIEKVLGKDALFDDEGRTVKGVDRLGLKRNPIATATVTRIPSAQGMTSTFHVLDASQMTRAFTARQLVDSLRLEAAKPISSGVYYSDPITQDDMRRTP